MQLFQILDMAGIELDYIASDNFYDAAHEYLKKIGTPEYLVACYLLDRATTNKHFVVKGEDNRTLVFRYKLFTDGRRPTEK